MVDFVEAFSIVASDLKVESSVLHSLWILNAPSPRGELTFH